MRPISKEKFMECIQLECPAAIDSGSGSYCLKEKCIFEDDEDGRDTGEKV